MPSGISTSCPHCGKSLKVKNRSALGKRVPCPQCKRPFVVTSEPELDHYDNFGMEQSYEDDYESFAETPAPRRNRKSPKRRSRRKKKPNNLPMIIGGLSGLGAGLMMLLALLLGRNGGGADSSPAPIPPKIALTDEECVKQGEVIKDLLVGGNIEGLNQQFNWEVFATASIANIDLPARKRREMIAEATNSSMTHKFLPQIIGSALNSRIRFLRVVTVEDEKRARFRLLGEESGVIYFDFVLQKRPLAGIQIVDIYTFFSGELMTESLNRVFLQLAAHESRGILDKLTQAQSDYISSLEDIAEMGQHIQSGRPAEVLQIYHRLPPSVQADRSILVLRLRAASEAGDDNDYTNAIDMMRQHHPDNVALDFVSLDYYYIKKQFDEVLASVDHVDQAVGGDPYLHVIRANTYLELEQMDKARESFQAAIQQEPTLESAYDNALQLEIVVEDYARAADLLNQYEEQCGKTTGVFSKLAEYAKFQKSDEYRNRK